MFYLFSYKLLSQSSSSKDQHSLKMAMTIDPLKRAPLSLLIICLQEVVFSIAHSFFFLLKWSAIVLQNCLQEEIWFHVSLSLSQGYIFNNNSRSLLKRGVTWLNFFSLLTYKCKNCQLREKYPPPKPRVRIFVSFSFLKTITLMPLDAATVNVSRNPFC